MFSYKAYNTCQTSRLRYRSRKHFLSNSSFSRKITIDIRSDILWHHAEIAVIKSCSSFIIIHDLNAQKGSDRVKKIVPIVVIKVSKHVVAFKITSNFLKERDKNDGKKKSRVTYTGHNSDRRKLANRKLCTNIKE